MNDITKETKPDKPKFNWDAWYAGNKERLSQKRKDRYKNDPEYREKVTALSKKYRASLPPKPRKKSDKMTIPQLCEKAGCSFHTFRKYQQLGWIPKCTKAFTFTDTHVELLADLINKANETLYLRKNRLEVLQPYIDAIAKNWLVHHDDNDVQS